MQAQVIDQPTLVISFTPVEAMALVTAAAFAEDALSTSDVENHKIVAAILGNFSRGLKPAFQIDQETGA